MEDEQSTAPQEQEAPVESPAEDPILSVLSDTEDEAPAEVEETPKEEVANAEVEPPTEKPTEESEELLPEDDPKEVARRQYEARKQAQAEREARVRQVTDPYIAEATEAGDEVEARLRNMEAERYIEKVERVTESIVSEFERVKADPDLQIFNPDNTESFNQKAYDKALRDFNAGYIQYDTSGNMIGLKGSLIEHFKETAELLSGAQKTGAVQQVRATRSMRANADTKPAATPKAPEKDAILEILKSD